MGSSMVIMCSSRSLLILSSMAASVVDFPEPVGPVTSTRPRGLSQSPLTTVGKPKRVEALDLPGNGTKNGADGAALIEHVAAKARQVLKSEGKVQLQVFLEAVLLRVGQHAVGQRLRVGGRQGRHIQGPQVSVNADARRAIRGDVEVAASHLDHFFQQFAQGNSGHRFTFFL